MCTNENNKQFLNWTETEFWNLRTSEWIKPHNVDRRPLMKKSNLNRPSERQKICEASLRGKRERGEKDKVWGITRAMPWFIPKRKASSTKINLSQRNKFNFDKKLTYDSRIHLVHIRSLDDNRTATYEIKFVKNLKFISTFFLLQTLYTDHKKIELNW